MPFSFSCPCAAQYFKIQWHFVWLPCDFKHSNEDVCSVLYATVVYMRLAYIAQRISPLISFFSIIYARFPNHRSSLYSDNFERSFFSIIEFPFLCLIFLWKHIERSNRTVLLAAWTICRFPGTLVIWNSGGSDIEKRASATVLSTWKMTTLFASGDPQKSCKKNNTRKKCDLMIK